MTVRSLLEVFRGVIESLEAHGIEYMVVGSIASVVYGEPRLTADMDVVVEIPLALVPRFEQIFPPERFYVPPREILAQEIVNRRQFNILDNDTGLKVDFIVRRADAHSVAEFGRRRRVAFLPGFEVFMASPEDVILKKLVYFQAGKSLKHIADIKGIVAQTELDLPYLTRWVAVLDLQEAWALVGA